MQLDIRFPIGLLFGILGLMLIAFGLGPVFGAWSDPAIYQRSLGINVNLWWGLILVIFSGVMLGLAVRRKKADSAGH